MSGEQIVAGRLDGLGVLHLFVGQVAVRIVGQQFGQDQRGVQRRAQLMRHVGEKVGFVAARLFEFPRLQLHDRVGAFQVVPLGFELSAPALRAGVGLLEFGLLLFQPRLRFLQRPALLFQFLV